MQCVEKLAIYDSLTLRRDIERKSWLGFRILFFYFLGLLNPMSVPRSLDGFDVIAAVERMLDQPALWWQAVGLFVEHFADWEGQWQASIGNDLQERKRVHAVRSAAANVGAMRLAEAAGGLEDVLLKRLAGQAVEIPESMRDRLRDSFHQAWQAAAEAWQINRLGPGGQA